MCHGNLIHISPTISTTTTRLITYSQSQLRQIVNNPNHVKGCLNQGTIAPIAKLKINRRKISTSPRLNSKGSKPKQLKTNNNNRIKWFRSGQQHHTCHLECKIGKEQRPNNKPGAKIDIRIDKK